MAAHRNRLPLGDAPQVGRRCRRVIAPALLQVVTVSPVRFENVVELRTIEAGRQKGFHQLRLIHRQNMVEPHAVAHLMRKHIPQT